MHGKEDFTGLNFRLAVRQFIPSIQRKKGHKNNRPIPIIKTTLELKHRHVRSLDDGTMHMCNTPVLNVNIDDVDKSVYTLYGYELNIDRSYINLLINKVFALHSLIAYRLVDCDDALSI